MYKAILNPFTSKLQLVLDNAIFQIKESVDTYNSLPITNNSENDIRFTQDTDFMYTWTKANPDGQLSDWLKIGSVSSVDWSILTNKPTSSVNDIDDAVSKKHVQNSDTGTLSNYFYIGDGTEGVKELFANVPGSTKPKIRYNPTTQKWEVSHDRIRFYALAEGHDIAKITEDTVINGSTDTVYCDSTSPITVTLPQSQGEARIIRFKNINTADVKIQGFLSAGTLSWSNLTNSGQRVFMDVACSSDGTKIVVAVQNGYIYTSTNSGATWTERTSAGSRFWSSVCMSSDGNTIYATGLFLGIYKSINGGTDWSTIATPLASVQWRRIRCSSDGSVVAISGQRSSHVAMFTSVNGGTNWTQHTSVGSGGENFKALAMSANGQVIIVSASNQNPRVTINGGTSWEVKTGPGARPWHNADCSDDGSVIALVGNSNNYIYTSSDTGENWQERTNAPQRNWEGVAVNSDGSIILAGVGYFAGGTDYIYLSLDEGLTWEAQEDAGSSQWNGLTVSSDGSLMYGIRYNDWVVKGSSTPGERDQIDCEDEIILKTNDAILLIDSEDCEWNILSHHIDRQLVKNTINGSFTTVDGKTITVVDGQITEISE